MKKSSVQSNKKSNNKSNRKLFINLPVKDLNKSVKFFTKLGFKFNPQFTDKNATSMIISEDGYVMLLVEKFFKKFIVKKAIVNAKKNTEVLTAVSLNSRKEVDTMVNIAIKNGGKKLNSYDHGFMYGIDFEDLDGHIWEIFYMDITKYPKK